MGRPPTDDAVPSCLSGGPEEDAGDDTNGSRQADGAVSRLLQTFSNLRAKFEVEFANVICAVNGLQQFKVQRLYDLHDDYHASQGCPA